ncbi:peptide MFS transporter [Kordiimonas aestuarii]|uniref:peptide MFS transporter n=1 Tax=Kordiimonas aestuarii TaxID=1005925 RepID=UPI0021D0561F|nr:peptide MFS transporter [Kordiimonas aestuarii]
MQNDLNTSAAEDMPGRTDILGHPRGLAYIVFTEAWERFSFYGMQALLVLYMAGHLLKPGAVEGVIAFSGFHSLLETVFGPLSTQALATQIFGLYIGLIYFMPVLGGFIGDRVMGQKKAVLLGAALMALGHFLMAFETVFLFALSALILGAGLLKGNLAAQVGRLYAKGDQRRDTAYSLYIMSINVGAFVAPLICGTLGELYGWHYGFGAAGVGMMVGIVIYLRGQHFLPPDTMADAGATRPKLQKGDGKVIAAILLLFVIAALFWTAQTQVWNTYPLWIRDRVDREIFDLTIPVTWFQSFDSLAVLVLGPFVMWYWKRQRDRKAEPGDLMKVILGCAVFTLACVWLALGEFAAGGGQVSLFWPVVFHFICAIGYLYVGPIMLALVSSTAPEAVNAMMVGSYYLSLFFGGIASGWLGRFYEPMSDAGFWLMHGAIVGLAAVLVLLLHRPFRTVLKLH